MALGFYFHQNHEQKLSANPADYKLVINPFKAIIKNNNSPIPLSYRLLLTPALALILAFSLAPDI